MCQEGRLNSGRTGWVPLWLGNGLRVSLTLMNYQLVPEFGHVELVKPFKVGLPSRISVGITFRKGSCWCQRVDLFSQGRVCVCVCDVCVHGDQRT